MEAMYTLLEPILRLEEGNCVPPAEHLGRVYAVRGSACRPGCGVEDIVWATATRRLKIQTCRRARVSKNQPSFL